MFYGLSLLFTKLSILFLFLRVLTFEWIRWAVRVVLAVVVLSSIFIVGVVFTACVPLQAFWDRSRTPAYCHPISVWWAVTGILIATDVAIYLLPRA